MQESTVHVNIVPGGMPVVLHISQYDVGLRQYTFTLYSTQGTWEYVSGASATLEATKPDNHAIVHNCTYNNDGTITYTVQEQLAAVVGRVWSKLVIRDTNSNVLGTIAIIWIVDPAGVTDSAIVSDSDISALQEFLAEFGTINAYKADLDSLRSLATGVNVAATKAAMTNHNIAYVYTGSESGMVTNNWYWYNGSDWVSGGAWEASVATDTTLTTSGKAADAKATGDAIAELKSDIKLAYEGIQTFELYADFKAGGLNTDGTVKDTQQYRVSCSDKITFDRDIVIHVASGFRWGYIPFTGNTPGSWVGWMTSDYTMRAGTTFVVQIARTTEVTSEVADVSTFVNTITFNTNVLDVANDVNDNLVNLKSEVIDHKIRLDFESGSYSISGGAISQNNTEWQLQNFRRTAIVKVPAYSQFIITNSDIRGYLYVSVDNGSTYTSYNWLTSSNKKYMPAVDAYVAIALTNAEGKSVPTTAQCHDGFYIQPPFDTKDYSDLVSYDSRLRPIEKVNPVGKFVIGSIGSGVIGLNNNNRIVFTDMLSFGTDITIRPASGFRFGINIFVNGTYTSDEGGFKSSAYDVPKNTTFKMIISRTTEQTETGDSWWVDFVKAITFEAKNLKAVPNISVNKPFMFSSRPKFMMHRGLQSEAPENSVPAFTLAGQANAWAIETDVYETSDGYLVCIHDDTVDRTTDGTGNVRDFTLAQIEALTIDTGAHIEDYPNLKIPTFEEYLAVCKTYGCTAFIEIKGVTNLQKLYNTVVQYGMLYNCVFTVWESLLKDIRAIDVDAVVPCMINGYSSAETYDTVLAVASKYNNVMAGLETSVLLTDTIITNAHTADIAVGCWTVNDKATAIGYFERGIDFVTSNSLTDFS